MRILVTGNLGYIGSVLVPILKKEMDNLFLERKTQIKKSNT